MVTETRYGYCQCGCGQKTGIAIQSHTKLGWVKGEPKHYVVGHGARGKRRPPSALRHVGDIIEVSLSRERGFTIVDAADEAVVAGRRWRIKMGYAVTDHPAVPLHWLIIGKPEAGLLVDHRNGDRLDNRRSNLRFADHSLNNFNRRELDPKSKTGVPGVFKMGGRYRASLSYQNRLVYLGMADTVAEAAQKRAAAELEYFGEICTPTAAALAQLGLAA